MSKSEKQKFILLIVDDSPNRLQVWCSAGERAGSYTVLFEESYEAAMDTLRNNAVDVLVADLFLSPASTESEDPEQAEGLRLIQRCRALYPRCWIVAITRLGGTGTEIGARAYRAGANDFISAAWEHVDPAALLEHKLRIYATLLKGAAQPARPQVSSQ
jgi:CheY-like chemotaxis protein